MRLEKQRQARQSGTPELIIDTSKKLIASALLELGKWRSQEDAYPQAQAIYRTALLLEDTQQTRDLLSDAEFRSPQGFRPFTLNPVDPAAPVNTSDLANAKLTPLQFQQGNLREKHLRRILGGAYNDWGAAEAKLEQYSAAMAHFELGRRWDPSTPDLMRNLGMAAMKLGQNGEAEQAFKTAIEQSPRDKLLRSLLAVSQFSVGDYQQAASSFSQVTELASRDPDMTYAWAFSLSRSDRLKEASAVLDKMSERSLSAEMLVSVGRLYWDLGNYERSLRWFRSALQKDPSIKKAHDGAGMALVRMHSFAEAVPEFEAELKLVGEDHDVQYWLAYALLQLSEKEKAVALLRSLLAAKPDHAQARYQLGKEMLESGQLEEAIQNLEVAATLEPDRAYVHYQLQSAYRRAGRLADADREAELYRALKKRDRERIPIQGAHEEPSTE